MQTFPMFVWVSCYCLVGVGGVMVRPRRVRVALWVSAVAMLALGLFSSWREGLRDPVDFLAVAVVLAPVAGCLIGELIHPGGRKVRLRWVLRTESVIYISPADKAKGYAVAPEHFVERARYRGLTTLELMTLWALLRENEGVADKKDDFQCLFKDDGGDCAIFRLPVAMAADLARLTPERLAPLAAQWADARRRLCPPYDARRALEDLARLSRRACENRWGMYLWSRELALCLG